MMKQHFTYSFFSFLFGIFSLGFSSFSYTQNVQFLSSEDSSSVRVSVYVYDSGQRVDHWQVANGLVDFSGISDGHFIEILSTGFDIRSFNKTSDLPSVIYLSKKATRIDEFVVTGQLQQTSVSDAIQNVRIINAKKIEQMGAQNLTQLFRNELNIQLSTDAILGMSMDLQGISGENVKILVDGVPIIGRLNGTVDLDQINIQNIDKIEIIEGPLSVNYGSDALAGTVNIITKKTSNGKIQGKMYGYYESNGTYNTQGNVSTHLGNTWLSVDVNRNYFDGWNPYETAFYMEKKRMADSTRNKLYKPREQVFGGLKIRQSFPTKRDENIFVTADIRLFQEEIENRGLPVKPYFIYAFDDYYRTFRSDNSLSIEGKIAKRWRINSSHAYNFFERKKSTYSNDLTTLSKKMAGASEQDTSSFDLVLSRTGFIYETSTQWLFEVGYDLNIESSKGKRIQDNGSSMGDYALFMTTEYSPINRLVIKPGVRVSHNTVYSSPVVPSLFVKYQLTENNHLRASYSRGYRAPSLKELYYYFVDINHNIKGNSDLKAETSNNYQLSLRTDYEKGRCRLVVSNQFFYNDLDNLITLGQVEGSDSEYSYVNLAKSKTYGYTLNANFIRKNFSMDAGFSLKARATQIYLNESPRHGSMYPEIKASPSYLIPKTNTTIGVFYKFTGQMPNFVVSSDGIVSEQKRESYHTLDLTFVSKFWDDRLGLTLGVKNLLDVTRIKGIADSGSPHGTGSSSVLIGMGRTYFCSLVFTIHSKNNSKNEI